MANGYRLLAIRTAAAVWLLLITDSLGAASAPDVVVQFDKGPKIQRIRNESSLRHFESAVIAATVLVTNGDEPIPETPVTLSGRSKAGVFGSARGKTDRAGRAEMEIVFENPLGSLVTDVQVCLTDAPAVCTSVVSVSARDWVDLDLVSHFGVSWARLPEEVYVSFFQPINTDYVLSTTAASTLRINLLESQHEWKYYRIAVYGQVPVTASARVAGYSFTPTTPSYLEVIDNTAGIDDVSAGLDIAVRGILFANVSYNSRTGKVNEIEDFRNQERAVSRGDGFESIDTTIEARHFLGEGAFLTAEVSNSQARVRKLPGLISAKRGDTNGFQAGIGFIQGQDTAMIVSAGMHRFGSLRFNRGTTLQTHLPGQDVYLIRLSRTGLTRQRTRLGFGVTFAHAPRQGNRVSMDTSIHFSAF